MKLLLRSDVSGVGKRGDIVDVADGYARNYLVPKGFAIKASPGVNRQAEMMRRSRAIKDATDRASAEEVAKVLVPSVITITRRAGSEGKLFGSVTVADVAEAVYSQKNIELDRKDPVSVARTHAASPSCQSRLPTRSRRCSINR